MSEIKKNSRGFTLIELVVVISILAILAAMALPRFASLQADARLSKMNGALASVKSAAAMAHAQLIARGFGASSTIPVASSTIAMEGIAVGFVNGYPDASQIAAIAGLDASEFYLPTATATSQIIGSDGDHNGVAPNPDCSFVYNEPASASLQPGYTVNNLTLANCQ